MSKNKKIVLIGGIIESVILIFNIIVSIIVWTTTTNVNDLPAGANWQQMNIDKNGEFIAFFQNNPTAFFLIICVPVFIIVALDFIYFAVLLSKRESNLTEEELEVLRKKAEAEVREELLREMLSEGSENPENKEE